MKKIVNPLVIILIIFFLENILKISKNGTLLIVILFFSSISQGAIALVAAAELSKGKWIDPIKKNLLSLHKMILVVFFLFLIFSFKLKEVYPWVVLNSGWLNSDFFILRNGIFLFASYIFAKSLFKETTLEASRKKLFSTLYLLSFTASQSLSAFDLVMTLEYPWYSTLFGGYTFIEALYSGIAISVIILKIKEKKNSLDEKFKKVLVDLSKMIFGFSLLWAGLFYSQFLVIWYGNLPEEVEFFIKRIIHLPFKILGYSIIFFLFVFPFSILLSRRIKENLKIVFFVSLFILSSLIAERFFYILPHLKVNPIVFSFEIILLSLLFIKTIKNSL